MRQSPLRHAAGQLHAGGKAHAYALVTARVEKFGTKLAMHDRLRKPKRILNHLTRQETCGARRNALNREGAIF